MCCANSKTIIELFKNDDNKLSFNDFVWLLLVQIHKFVVKFVIVNPHLSKRLLEYQLISLKKALWNWLEILGFISQLARSTSKNCKSIHQTISLWFFFLVLCHSANHTNCIFFCLYFVRRSPFEPEFSKRFANTLVRKAKVYRCHLCLVFTLH